MKPPTIFIICDSITNSVFESQVLIPLRHLKEKIILVSFERKKIRSKLLLYFKKHYPQVTFIIQQQPFFWGTFSLKPCIIFLKKFLEKNKQCTIIARGPLAGYIAKKSKQKKQKLTIQARGLLAQEYWYTHKHSLIWPLHYIRFLLFNSLETLVYNTFCVVEKTENKKITFQAVSPELKKYLIKNFAVPKKLITVAQHDIPQKITLTHKEKKVLRTKLNIAQDAFVYAYSGSYKSWQCCPEMIDFFLEQYQKNAACFLLIITPDTKPFKTLLTQKKVPQNTYTLIATTTEQTQRLLYAADTGILFRKKHLINWIARPTKILEYQAAGLPIIHNNTIAYLMPSKL